MLGTRMMRLEALSCAVLAALAVSMMELPRADAQSGEEGDVALRSAIIAQYGENFDIDQLSSYIAHLYKAVDHDRRGLDNAEIEFFKRIQDAQDRSQVASQILLYDLDGDGVVAREEIKTILATRFRGPARDASGQLNERTKRRIAERADRLLVTDPNNDGRIEPDEYAAWAKHPEFAIYRPYDLRATVAEALLARDPNGDGRVTQVEALRIFANAFGGLPMTSSKQSSVANGRAPAGHCKPPRAGKGQHVILVAGYHGSAVSSVTVAGQDQETSTAQFVVEPGEESLFLMATSHTPMIWRLAGATDRVAHILVAGRKLADGRIAGGVTGVAAEKVSFLPARDCLPYFSEVDDVEGARAAVVTIKLVGAMPERIFSLHTVHELHLSSGIHSQPKNPGRVIVRDGAGTTGEVGDGDSPAVKALENAATSGELTWNLLRTNPGGVLKLRSNKVANDGTAQDYQVLPHAAGLLQLIASGTLEQVARGQFRIVEKMRYPAGLTGDHRVKFMLKAGVPEPDGDPGGSCTYSEDEGRLIAGHCGGTRF